MTPNPKIGTRTPGAVTEFLVHSGPCVLYGIYPELTTTGTITLRNGAATGGSDVRHVAAIGLTQAGKQFDGILFEKGLTIQLSVATDLTMVVWEALIR